MLAHHGASIAHLPSSNLKLASGFAPVAPCSTRINVGIGTTARRATTAWICSRKCAPPRFSRSGGERRPGAAPHQALAAATLHGAARSPGCVGRLARAGQVRHLCAVAFDEPELAPCYDPVSHLAYSRDASSIACVGRGETRVLERKLVGFENRNLNNRPLLAE